MPARSGPESRLLGREASHTALREVIKCKTQSRAVKLLQRRPPEETQWPLCPGGPGWVAHANKVSKASKGIGQPATDLRESDGKEQYVLWQSTPRTASGVPAAMTAGGRDLTLQIEIHSTWTSDPGAPKAREMTIVIEDLSYLHTSEARQLQGAQAKPQTP